MPVQQLPDFEQTLAIANGQLDAIELSECHGAACGLICRHPHSQADLFLSLLNSLELLKDPEQSLAEQLVELYQATVSQLEDDQLRLVIWLPDDDEPLEDRTEALARWCTGFLAGLGSGSEFNEDTLSEDVTAALSDIQQIAMAEMTSDGDSDEEEAALIEIIEYIRVVTLMMKEELSPPDSHDRLH
jgi:uncharacterized protein YgfB (UPF0149 family)